MATGPDVQVWATAISTNESNGRKIFFRYARVFSPAFDRASQPVRIIITWKFQSETGQPATEEQQRMILFEDALGTVLEQERFATLALVSTGENLREWIYYAKSEADLRRDSNTPWPVCRRSRSKSILLTIRYGRLTTSLGAPDS